MAYISIEDLQSKVDYLWDRYVEWQAVVDRLEEQARIASTAHQRPVGGRRLPEAYVSKRILEDSFNYSRATGARDGYLKAYYAYSDRLQSVLRGYA